MVELTEEELEQQRSEAENNAINEGAEAYAELDANAETKKLQEKEMAKLGKRKAVSRAASNSIQRSQPCNCAIGDPPFGAKSPLIR